MADTQALADLNILVTRPSGLAEPLCEQIRQLGGNASHYPVIQIVAPENPQSAQRAIDTINSYDIAIFISPTAVEKTVAIIDLSISRLIIAAIGSATTAALEHKQLKVTIRPEGHDSESLLEHAALQQVQINNKNIIIFKGEGGLSLLSDTLIHRGANVVSANMYCRAMPEEYQAISKSFLSGIDCVLISSGEGLTNLLNMVEDKAQLCRTNIIVPGNRVANMASELGFTSIIKALNATNTAYISVLQDLALSKHR